MIHNPPLLTIHRGFRRPDPKLVEAFRGAQTSHLVDAMDGRGVSPSPPARAGLGTVGAPVTLGGVHVSPGDIVVGDEDAVVVVPLARAEAVLERLAEVRAAEAKTEKSVAEGLTMSPAMADILANAAIVEH